MGLSLATVRMRGFRKVGIPQSVAQDYGRSYRLNRKQAQDINKIVVAWYGLIEALGGIGICDARNEIRCTSER